MMDRARWLRANNFNSAAEQLAARDHQLSLQAGRSRAFLRHADPARRGRGAGPELADRVQYREPDRRRASRWRCGRRPTDRHPRQLHDTGVARRKHCARQDEPPGSAVAMFDRYGRAGRSLQVQTKGSYWAGRAALAAGPFAGREHLFPARGRLPGPVLRPARAGAARPLRHPSAPGTAAICHDPALSGRPSTAAAWCRRSGCSGSRAARPSRLCSSGRWPNRSTMTATATSRCSSASRSAARTSPCGPRAWRE